MEALAEASVRDFMDWERAVHGTAVVQDEPSQNIIQVEVVMFA